MASITMCFIVKHLVRKCPTKTICTIVILGPIIYQMFGIYYSNPEHQIPSTLCSSRYPGYSKILDMSVTLPEGSIQAGGWIYPPDAVWWESSIVHGCPCSVGPCIRPCLPKVKHYKVNTQKIIKESFLEKVEYNQVETLLVSSGSDPLVKVNVSAKHFSILDGNCIKGLRLANELSLTNNAKVWEKDKLYDTANYGLCFNVKNGKILMNKAFQCYYIDDKNGKSSSSRFYMTAIEIEAIAAILVLLTLVIYMLVPHLRQKYYSKSLINYTLALFIWKVLDITNVFCEVNSMVCGEYTGVPLDSWSITVILWQGVMVWEMRAVFKPGKLRTLNNRKEGNTIIIIHSLLIWGAFGGNVLLQFYIPEERNKRYLELVALLVNLYLNVSALLRLRTCLKDSKNTQGPESQRHNVKEFQWISLFLKFTFISSLDFTVVAIARIFFIMSYGQRFSLHSLFRYIVALDMQFNCLKGVELFFLNVWQKETWTALKNRFFSRK